MNDYLQDLTETNYDNWIDDDCTEEEFEAMLSKYDIDLKEEEEQAEEFSPMLQRYKGNR